MSLRIIRLCALMALVGTAAQAAEFVVDENGGSPRRYRMTALCKGIDSFIDPDAYKTSIFNREGSSLKATNIGLEIGVQDGKMMLVLRDWSGSADKYTIVGDATNLDDIRTLPGIKIRGYQEWDMLSHAWRQKMEYAAGVTPAPFTGTLFDHPQALDRILSNIEKGGTAETESNAKVLNSFFYSWWSNVSRLDNGRTKDTARQELQTIYADRITAAASRFNATQKASLVQFNEMVLEGMIEVRDYVKENEQWHPERLEICNELVQKMEELHASLTR